MYIFNIWGIVVWNIVKLFWFKLRNSSLRDIKTRFPENMLVFLLLPNATWKYPFKEYRPHRPKSYVLWICLSESLGAAQLQKGLPCGLFTATAGFMIEQKTDQTCCLELSAHMPTLDHIVLPSVIVSTTTLLIYQEGMPYFPQPFQPIPVFLLAYQRNQLSLLQSSLFLRILLGFSFPKRESCGLYQWWYVLLVQRIVYWRPETCHQIMMGSSLGSQKVRGHDCI